MDRAGAVFRLEAERNTDRTVRVLALQGEPAALMERFWQAFEVGRMQERVTGEGSFIAARDGVSAQVPARFMSWP